MEQDLYCYLILHFLQSACLACSFIFNTWSEWTQRISKIIDNFNYVFSVMTKMFI